MNKMTDVYRSVDMYLMERNFQNCTISEQKELVEEGLKEFIIRKIWETDLFKGMNLQEKKDELTLEELVIILGEKIPEKEHFDTIRHLIHYILNVAGTMQNYLIVWYEEDDSTFIKSPRVDFDENGRWDKFTSHKDTSYIHAFNFIYHTFKNEFKSKKNTREYVLNNK